MPDAIPMTPLIRPQVTLRALPPCTRLSLRGAEPSLASSALGFALPLAPLTSGAAGGRAALWLGPDEWLVLSDEASLPERLAEAFGEVPASVVDISARQIAFEIAGPGAADVLNEGCPLDLSDAAFGAGACTRTLFGKVEVILWRPGPAPAWRLEVWRSFALHLWAHLAEAARDH